MFIFNLTVFQITASTSARSRQLWRRTGNFFKTFLQFYVYDLRFKAAGLTSFLLSFEHYIASSLMISMPVLWGTGLYHTIHNLTSGI